MLKRGSQKPYLASKQPTAHMELELVSEQHSKIEANPPQEVLPRAIEDELQLNLEKYSREIKDEIRYVLIDLLKYPSAATAERHRASNRLGAFDLKEIKNKQIATAQYFPSHHPPQICQDCGLMVQEREIPVCSSVWEFPHAGESVFHFFENAKLLGGQVFLLGVVFSIFSLYISIVQPTETFSFATLPRKVSYTALMLYSSSNALLAILLSVEAILLLVTTLAWWFLFFISQCLRQKYERIVEQEDLSAADFTVKLDDLPAYYTKERLQNEFNRYFQSLVYHHNLKHAWGEDLKPFEIDRISQSLPFGLSEGEVMDQELEGLDCDILEKRVLLAQWMMQFKENARFTFQKSDRKKEYENFERMQERRRVKLQQMEEKAREHYKLPQGKDLKTIYFVTFKHSQSASIIEQLNPQSLPAKIRYLLTCCRSAQYFSVRDEQSKQEISITATRAPDPFDIIWGNLMAPLKNRVLSRLLTWGVIVAFWGATFGVCYGFNYLAIQVAFIFMPVVLAVIVTLSNMLMKFAICMLSHYERDETESDRQRGILIKCLVALPVNWILTPVVLTLIVNHSLFDSTGLVYFVFFLAISNALLPPLFRLLDPYHFFRKARALWKNRPYKRMQLRQSELNAYLQNEEYEVGWCYVYFIEMFYFTCLYAPMMPAVVISTLAGYFFMYWVEKYVLLHRSKRPLQNMKLLTETANTAMLLGPLFIGVGGLVWVCLFSLDFSSIKFIAYMVEIGLGVLYFITPYRAIFKCFCTVPEEENLVYEECRIRLPTEYERLNPVSSEKGMADFYAFLQRKKEQDRATALNRSEGNLVEDMDINLVIDAMTKIPNIFGKNTDITRKIDGESFVKSRIRPRNQQIIFVTPAQNTLGIAQNQNEKEIEDLEVKFDDKTSRAETMVINYNSSGNAYCKRKPLHDRRTISVLQDVSYDPIFETQSQKH